jgi:acetolactate synthase-1/3 small subunit
MMPDNIHTLTLIVRDKPGVLVRVAQIFARRDYNISAIQVAPIEKDPTWSVMTITACNINRPDQIISQLEKLIDIKSVKHST